MADVAKSAVRADCGATGGGDDGGEEEEASLSAAIESELRGVLGKGWSGGWATVEEVLAAAPPLANGHATLTQPLTNGHGLASDLPPSESAERTSDLTQPSDHPTSPPSSPKVSSADLVSRVPGSPILDTSDNVSQEHLLDLSSRVSSPDLAEGLVDVSTPDFGDRSLDEPDFRGPLSDPNDTESSYQISHSPSPDLADQSSHSRSPDLADQSLHSGDLLPSDNQSPKISPLQSPVHSTPRPAARSPEDLPPVPADRSSHPGSPDPVKAVSPPSTPRDSITELSPLSDLPQTNGTQVVLHEEVQSCIESVLVNLVDETVVYTEETEITESSAIDKKKKKKTVLNGEATEEVTTTKKKTKKSKKTEGKENISVKSSFSKFDQLSKKTVLHVRSSDPAKAQKTFNQGAPDGQAAVLCKACQKQVFAMEQIKAERAIWHKNCFRCHTCNKQLTVDIYQSHEGLLYCKPHFRDLFQPKAVVDEEEPASDKPDLGLEELSSLNVKSKFQVFERQTDQHDGELERSPTTVSVKRSSSIMSKLAKFQKKGMDVGVTDESLNGFVYEETSSSEEESEEEEEEDKGVIKCRRKARERPVSFGKMNDVKKNWESLNQSQRREEMREERKLELQQIRSRMFQGKQGKMKELYEQAVAESEQKVGRKESIREDEELVSLSDKAKLARERFEKGEVGGVEGHESSKKELEEDMAVFEEGISKKSRNIFKEMEAAAKATPVTPSGHPQPIARADSVRRPRETESPEREVYRDPDVVRCDEKSEEESTILRSQTASRMLSVFRQLEEQKEVLPEGPKPKKCFTPPPDYRGGEDSSEEEGSEDEEGSEEEEEEEESETEEGVVKSSYKVKDDFLEQARNAARAKQLAAKFEQWEPEKQSTNNAINMLESEHASIESTKSLKARFESLQNEQPKEKSRPKVNRFVEQPTTALCAFCETKVYPLEKIETNGKIFHKNCFRCSYCNCILRMDTYTLNNGHLYCLPHFKQLFISKGNYDEGFGSDQHKRKWEQPLNGNTSS